jgi:hypothetical protein
MFLALEAPNTKTTDIVVVWIMAFIGNFLSYAAIGALTWPLVYIVRRVTTTHLNG